MARSLKYNLRDEEFIFDHRRAIVWPRKKTLIVTDLHWGKTQYFRNHGIGISDRVLETDLKRLASLLDDYDVQTVLVLGDLVHHEEALSKSIVEEIARFRGAYPSELILVKGNHDRFTRFPPSWGVVEEEALFYGEFAFVHDLMKDTGTYQFAGHVHPMLRIRAGHDFMRLPTFVLNNQFCLLPAFSLFTGGQDMKLKAGDLALVVTEDSIEELK